MLATTTTTDAITACLCGLQSLERDLDLLGRYGHDQGVVSPVYPP